MKRLFFAPRGSSPWERLLRGALLGAVFALVLVAYRKHFDAVIEKAQATGTVADPGHALTREDRTAILELAQALRGRFGLDLRVRVGGGPPGDVAAGPKTAFFYVDPACRASRVVLAPLAASALPAGFAEDLGREHLDANCRQGRLREGVLAALGLFVDSLDAAAGRGKGEQRQ
ncbi:TPM domain-containing protein [Solidesulfovibrio sp.]|uniref:TPM domain-containing protein n=1 Tax=Solidesulfovibrio sp. TaxID=2910990 RepID=UPI002B1FC38F|nr:TPM domain-containing protein [Solidesulfovibrio sp.]MEA5089291.1 TPM domain-containing protein [Solidesulfovibrio sp.]